MTRAGRLGWQYAGGYVRTRSARRPGDTGIEPVKADEAFAGDDALVSSPDPASKPVRPAGWSVSCSSAAHVVTVVTCLRDCLIGVNAWRANPTQARRY